MQPCVDVTLVGDSIRLYAEPFVRERLPPRFRVRSPSVNCRSSHTVAAMIREWVPAASAEVVHINCGLHDVRHDPGQHRPVSSPDEYVANLRRVFTYLATTGASVIWATSTPVNDAVHTRLALPRWYRADLVEYNRLSVGLARDFGFQVNDLYTRLSGMAADAWFLPDGVHFNHAGNRLIGECVAAAIQHAVPDPPSRATPIRAPA